MTAFLESLSKKLAERWLTLLVLPGALWVATAVVAARLHNHGALNFRALIEEINRWATRPHGTGAVVLVIVGLLLASAVAGLAATGLGAVVRRLWMTRGRRRPARWLVGWRQRRWRTASKEADSLVAEAIRAETREDVVVSGPEIADALARRDAIALEFPQRPTWIGDRWLAGTVRVRRAYGLDLTVAWPRLWTVLPEPLRVDIATAQASYVAASTLNGWAVLYGVLGVWWWPALLCGAATVIAGAIRSRAATATLCVLVETAADLHGVTLAEHLRHPLSASEGDELTSLLRKDDHPPPGS
ncbi:hypothetical protein NLX83_29960 [Allokutzneria sp. A3M-2-11 16]|uniref:hypothetical protein n=1 Tax=Allokutzneria sp. A3M-2-11 16 TaxID=2962043 RepID=UPI0020B7F376|nr:hypothetical protein [Allokutzneria sp. A3M-2-11 16]MCP3803504.1 hypothetical protein [Allokutzneria sp. A3M-2-11 16]